MKRRYWIFSYPEYYPGGGLSDLYGRYETHEEALAVYGEHGKMVENLGGSAMLIDVEEWVVWDESYKVWRPCGLDEKPGPETAYEKKLQAGREGKL